KDGDGYGTTAVMACAPTAGLAIKAGDCNDNDPAVNPGAVEGSGNGIDDDCNPATPDTGVAWPCEGGEAGVVTWSAAFKVESCVITVGGGVRLVGTFATFGGTFAVLTLQECEISDFTNEAFTEEITTPAEAASCVASLRSIAAADGITCP